MLHRAHYLLVCVPSRYAGILTTPFLQRTNIVFVFAFACWVGLLQIKFEPVHSQTLSQRHQPPSPLSSCRERNYVRQKIVTDVQCKAFIGSADLAMHLLLSSKHNRHISAEIKKRFLCKSETLCPTSALSHEMSLWNKLFKLNVVSPDFFFNEIMRLIHDICLLFKAISHPKAALHQKCTFSQ